MSSAHLELKGVHREFGKGETAVRVLESADLEVKSGELVAIVAPSGAGKSTLLHICGLLERAQHGEVAINGVPTSSMGDRQRTMLRRNTIGYVYQFHHLLPEFTALENVVMPQLIAGRAQVEGETRAQALLGLLGVDQRARHRPAEMSGGEQQRVAIARAAANHPRVILADEPTGNLDPATSDLVFGALLSLIREEGAAGLIATHNHDLAKRADRIVTIKDGKVEPLVL
jgi:lipoprotein-releasing system ATP-binding protein